MPTFNEANRITNLRGKPFRLEGPELQVGDLAPDFQVVNSSLQNVSLNETGPGVRIFSVVPSLDTPVCDAQTKRFEDETAKSTDFQVFTISMDLPFAQQRWCGNYGIDRVVMLSDHRTASFGAGYGTLIAELRIESRAIFVIDADNRIRYVEYVNEVGDHPNYEAALEAARSTLPAAKS